MDSTTLARDEGQLHISEEEALPVCSPQHDSTSTSLAGCSLEAALGDNSGTQSAQYCPPLPAADSPSNESNPTAAPTQTETPAPTANDTALTASCAAAAVSTTPASSGSADPSAAASSSSSSAVAETDRCVDALADALIASLKPALSRASSHVDTLLYAVRTCIQRSLHSLCCVLTTCCSYWTSGVRLILCNCLYFIDFLHKLS